MIDVRAARPDDAAAWLRLRRQLWIDGAEKEHAAEIAAYFEGRARAPAEVFLAFDASGYTVGFAELSIRWCAEGCETDHVAYLEGWYVVPEVRNRGVGRSLVAAAEDWARAQGCTELASDTQLDNDVSARAHEAVGFQEVGLVRCFRKPL